MCIIISIIYIIISLIIIKRIFISIGISVVVFYFIIIIIRSSSSSVILHFLSVCTGLY